MICYHLIVHFQDQSVNNLENETCEVIISPFILSSSFREKNRKWNILYYDSINSPVASNFHI